jgi:alpha-beta hydrolase superfamily lysophospholipase
MNTGTETILSKDKLRLKVKSIFARVDRKAALAIVHGMGEHHERFSHMADFFSAQGYDVHLIDLRGHGKSEGKRGHTPDYEHLMSDLDAFIGYCHTQSPQLPLFLFGHSMGGNLVLNYAIRRNPSIAGIIASAPYLKLAFEPPAWKVLLAKTVVGILPGFAQPTGLNPDHLSRDKEVVKAYQADPLVHDKMTPAFFMNVHFAGPFAIEHAHKIKLPALVYHGSGDKITSHLGSLELKNKAGENVEVKIFEGLYHELHNEPEKQEVFNYINNWIKQRL